MTSLRIQFINPNAIKWYRHNMPLVEGNIVAKVVCVLIQVSDLLVLRCFPNISHHPNLALRLLATASSPLSNMLIMQSRPMDCRYTLWKSRPKECVTKTKSLPPCPTKTPHHPPLQSPCSLFPASSTRSHDSSASLATRKTFRLMLRTHALSFSKCAMPTSLMLVTGCPSSSRLPWSCIVATAPDFVTTMDWPVVLVVSYWAFRV